jgi:hypothetical protein
MTVDQAPFAACSESKPAQQLGQNREADSA